MNGDISSGGVQGRNDRRSDPLAATGDQRPLTMKGCIPVRHLPLACSRSVKGTLVHRPPEEVTGLLIDTDLPAPDAHARAISEQLQARIRQSIEAAGGWLSFERYMEMALYEPGLGYYAAGSVKIGAGGDFVTAPELTPLFGRTIARQCMPWLEQLQNPAVLEIGPGTGSLAAALLEELARLNQPCPEYWLLETSPELKGRQQRTLAAWRETVRWLDTTPQQPFEAIVIINEVADALPVTRFSMDAGGPRPLGVRAAPALHLETGPSDPALSEAVGRIEVDCRARLPDGYQSEYCPRLVPWLKAMTERLTRGALLVLDYGLPRRGYYHPQHAGGRLVCHYRHRLHGDPLWWPGLCDMSAWVDFTALGQGAQAQGLRVSGFTTQAQWLMGAGLLELAAQRPDPAQSAALKTLLLPGEMGERFKAMLLTRDLEAGLPGRDLRDRL